MGGTAEPRIQGRSLKVGLAVISIAALFWGTSGPPVAAVMAPLPSPVSPALGAPVADATFIDINPDNLGPYPGQTAVGIPDCSAPCESGRDGGRVHNLSTVPGDASTYFAASEVGGLFKSTNGGTAWFHLDGYLPGTAWDVAAAPGGQRVVATSFNEGRLDLASVLQVSTDGGTTWTGRLPAAPAGCSTNRAAQPSAFGIALRPGANDVLVGTNCGLARSADGGDNWTRFDPTSTGSPSSVWDVVSLPGGRSYACGDDGLLVSPTGAEGSWTQLAHPNPGASFCSIAVSPEESNVVFAMFAFPTSYGDVFGAGTGDLYQGVVAFNPSTGAATGVTWLKLQNPDVLIGVKSRLPFVVTNDRSTGYDVWAGIGNVVRGTCATPATLPSPTTLRCSSWSATYTDRNGQLPQQAHGDSGDMTFDPTLSVDACPIHYSSDGGIYYNARANDPTTCHDPLFQGANSGLHAFMLWDMEVVNLPGSDAEDLYFGTQDNGLYYTADAGAAGPSWAHKIGGDTYDFAADATEVAASTNGGEIMAGDAGFVNMTLAAPGGTIKTNLNNPALDIPEFIAAAGGGRFMTAVRLATSWNGSPIPVGVFDTTDIANAPFQTPLGTWTSPRSPCHIKLGAGASGPQPYVLAGRCFWPDSGARSAFAADELWTYREVSPGVSGWVEIPVPPKQPGDPIQAGAGFGLIAVDPANANRLYASVVRDGAPRMMRSTDGGTSWTFDAGLTDLMLGGGTFIDYPAVTGDGIFPYLQPQFVAFDPFDADILVAGGASSGVFLSSDAGLTWSLLSDPFTPGASGTPHLPRPQFASFDHDMAGTVRVYLGTGRGIWRVDLPAADLSITKSDAPDPAFAGEQLTYTVTVANSGPTSATGVTVVDRLPSDADFDASSAPCVESPAGTLTCSVGTLLAGSQTSFTVTVDLPADLVYANGGPKSIVNSATVSGFQLDPNPSNNSTTATTLVKAKADLAIVSFVALSPPTAVVIGDPVQLTLRKVVANLGPSSPIDVAVSRSATAPAGSSVSPTSSSTTASAVAMGTPRTIDETFTITCGTPGLNTFAFANSIAPADSDDIDPDASNNVAATTVTVDCMVPVAINIQPGGFPNSLNLNGQATVAVLTTEAGEYGLPLAFDATTIDPLSVRFGPASVLAGPSGGATEIHGAGHIEDARELNEKTRDHDLDMVLHFRVADSGLTLADVEACVIGTFTTAAGTFTFYGCDSVNMTP
jgi:uncharacterized repeat protein (TIGR01451 family)